MSDAPEQTDTTETEDFKPDPEWQAFFEKESAAWKELAEYFKWPDRYEGEDEDEGEDDVAEEGDAVEAAMAETDAGEAVVNSKDSPLNPAIKHATAFFEMYLARRPSEIANQAASTAFHMFFNCPDSLVRADAAVEKMGDDSGALAAVAQTYIAMYNVERDEAAGDALGQHLLERLDSDERRSSLLLTMAESWLWNGQHPKARAACDRIIAMNAEESAVKQARALLYEMDNLNVGQMAPVFDSTDINGNPISLAGLRGKTVLIDFWATWCGPCRGEFPHLRRVNEKFTGDRFMLLSISLDEDCGEARKMIEQEKLTWTHMCEGKWRGSRIAELYNVMGIPSTWLIGPDGKIAAKELRGHALDKTIGELLNK